MEKFIVTKYASVNNYFVCLVEQYIPSEGGGFYKVSCYEDKTGGVVYETHTFEYECMDKRKAAYIAAMGQHMKNIENEC